MNMDGTSPAFRHSTDFGNVASAIVVASQAINALKKDARNSHFNSEYISLTAMTDAAKDVLREHTVTIMHTSRMHSTASGTCWVIVTTTALHDSGQWLEVDVPLPVAKLDPQGAASAITYGRRYGIASLLAIVADEDDDGNVASNIPSGQTTRLPQAGSASYTRATAARDAAPASAPMPRAASPASGAPSCPICGGAMWDNRVSKKNPRQPDYKCKNSPTCDGAIWPDKNKSSESKNPTLRPSSRPLPPPDEENFPPQQDGDEDDLPF